MAAARLTGELLYGDTLMQFDTVFWRESSVARPAPHGMLIVDAPIHASVDAGSSLKRMYSEESMYTSYERKGVNGGWAGDWQW